MVFAPKTARVAYTDPLWSWGGSPIRDTATPPRYHLFSSRMSANCGILHYCMNSEVIHLTSPNATGPFSYVETALAPRGDNWDNGAVPTRLRQFVLVLSVFRSTDLFCGEQVHGISVHRLPNGTYALCATRSVQNRVLSSHGDPGLLQVLHGRGAAGAEEAPELHRGQRRPHSEQDDRQPRRPPHWHRHIVEPRR